MCCYPADSVDIRDEFAVDDVLRTASRIRRSRELSCVASCVVGLGTTCRPCARRRRPRRARPTRITGGPRAVSGVAAPSTENHRSFVGGGVRAGAKRTRGNRTSRLDHVAFDRDRTGRHLQIWMGAANQPGSEALPARGRSPVSKSQLPGSIAVWEGSHICSHRRAKTDTAQ